MVISIWFNGDKWWLVYGLMVINRVLMVQNVVWHGLMVINGE